MFSPIRRSSLYLALWRLDISFSSSTRAGASEVGSAISTAAFASTRHNSATAGRPGGVEGGVYAHPPLPSQGFGGRGAVRSARAWAGFFAWAHHRLTISPARPGPPSFTPLPAHSR